MLAIPLLHRRGLFSRLRWGSLYVNSSNYFAPACHIAYHYDPRSLVDHFRSTALWQDRHPLSAYADAVVASLGQMNLWLLDLSQWHRIRQLLNPYAHSRKANGGSSEMAVGTATVFLFTSDGRLTRLGYTYRIVCTKPYPRIYVLLTEYSVFTVKIFSHSHHTRAC